MDGYQYLLLLIIPTSSADVLLAGSSSYAVLGQSFRFTCTVTGSSTGQLLTFKRDYGDVCTVSLNPCQQFSAPPGYTCPCGQSGVYNMDITSVSQRDERRWECVLSQTSNNIILPVYYGPFNNVTLDKPSPLTLTEDVTVSLTARCSADCKPACSYIWMKGTQQVSDNRVLPVGSFKRGQGGDYRCEARNTATGAAADSQTLTVNVQWHPAQPTHDCPPWIVRDQTVRCTCQTSDRGNPSGTVQWISPGGQMISSSVSSSVQLNLTSIRSSDNDRNYICRAGNSLPSSNSDTTYMASIAYLERPQLKFDKVEAQENTSVTVTCTVESNPIAEMTVEDIGSEAQPTFGVANTLTFTIDKTQCLQIMYRCTVKNIQMKTLISTVKQPNIACSPRPDSSKQTDTIVTGKIKTTASLTADVIANPLPNFTWYHYQGMTPVPVVIGTDNGVLTNGLQSVLKVHIKRNEDYGIYRVVVQNRQGIISLFFGITKDVSTPEAQSCNTLPVAVGEGTIIVILILVTVFIAYRRRLFKVLPEGYAVDDGKIMTSLQRHGSIHGRAVDDPLSTETGTYSSS
ncbi:carcinoembryonic antigen-related cell adhesion molecule 5-like [Haliotis rufescens]|uniref:carcinoembryonic antigen-related cell adhesion molecule 5-like n=1 Tax=Haliotis rufescens TaxID=6454 RepID=UPI00201ED9AB|nr:carcinoembryonic antigen-related cell adhesion molecule 5-like [Haliotis rufescens]